MDSGITSPSQLGFLAVVPRKLFFEEYKDLDNIESIKDAVGDILSFLQVSSKNLIPVTPCVISSKREVAL